MRNRLDTGYPRRKEPSHAKRNILSAIVALVVVLTFFSLDYVSDDPSIFSKSADKKLAFRGDLRERDFSQAEVNRLVSFIKRYDGELASVVVRTSLDDDYKEVADDAPVVFTVRLVTVDDVEIDTPSRRTTRANLLPAVLAKLRKDMNAYLEFRESGRDIRTFVNTM